MPNGAKSWCFTLNNYSVEELAVVSSFLSDHEQVEYGICGKEVGDGGTPHLQGYVKLQRRHDLQFVRDKLGVRAHFEVARGSARSNRSYCSKGGSFTEYGRRPPALRPSRDELAIEFRSALTRGNRGLDEFADRNPGTYLFTGHNLLRNSLSLVRPVVRPNIRVDWIWGPPGVGKSRRAHAELPEAYVKEPRTKWWNGYMMEKDVIIDDFGPNGIDINHLLRWFDRYKCMIEIKCGMMPLVAERFIVTSNFSPEDCFRDKFTGNEHAQHDALMRRITCINMYQ